MSDYIDRDLLLAEIKALKESPWYNGCGENYERIIRSDAIGVVVDLCIKSAPAVDVQKIKHGEWIKYRPENALDGAYFCSTCFEEQKMADGTITPMDRGYHYCPNCGTAAQKWTEVRMMIAKKALELLNDVEFSEKYQGVQEYTEMLIVCKEALEKQIPKKPVEGRSEIVCPTCKTLVGSSPYCRYCGQALDHSGTDNYFENYNKEEE